MANPNPSILDDIFVTTLRNSEKRIYDNMSKNNALYREMSKAGRKRTFTGPNIIEQISYGENGNFKWYQGFEQYPVGTSSVFTYAEYTPKQAVVSLPYSGRDEFRNSGVQQILDDRAQQLDVAEKTLVNKLTEGMYSLGLADGGKQIEGLQAYIADDPTMGIVGNIDAAAQAWWRNYARSVNVTSSNIVEEANRAIQSTKRGQDMVKLILSDTNMFNMLFAALNPQQRWVDVTKINVAMEFAFGNIPVINDGGIGGFCPANHMYFVNTDYLWLRPAASRDMVTSDRVRPANQDATVQSIFWAGNMTVSNRSLQGVLIDSTP